MKACHTPEIPTYLKCFYKTNFCIIHKDSEIFKIK